MGKPLKQLIRRTIYRGKPNLQSLDDPYADIARLLAGQRVQTVIDLGASDGRVAKRLGRLFPEARLHLFEPNPDYRAALEALHAEQPRFCHYDRVIGAEAGARTFFMTRDPGSSGLYAPTGAMTEAYPDQAARAGERTVDVTTLDGWSAEQGVDTIDLIKLDIQGGEADALRGASRLLDGSVKLIYTETFFQAFYEGGATFSDIDSVLRKHGFGLYSLYKPRHDERGRLLFADAIFVHADRLGW